MDKFVWIIIAVLCGITLVISLYEKKMEKFLNLMLRLIAGAVGIYLINTILVTMKIVSLVGLNPLNILVIGVLGLPGFALLYGLSAYFLIF
ncbi:MAG: pro-sigmaK processing inhibitor BofA family protein [bacterium]|nr:pro-sigmaK processing inhibitor BofA family protein [bacterium]